MGELDLLFFFFFFHVIFLEKYFVGLFFSAPEIWAHCVYVCKQLTRYIFKVTLDTRGIWNIGTYLERKEKNKQLARIQ